MLSPPAPVEVRVTIGRPGSDTAQKRCGTGPIRTSQMQTITSGE